jgi:hypothetical protein
VPTRVENTVAKNRIRIRIGSAFDGLLDPDPGGLKRNKMNEKMQPKDIYLGIKSIKSNVIGIKMGKCDFIFIKI